ncbi:MAG TPA: hypothetical protein VF618_18815 [Thermoanaerobaculia bacterium]
MPRKIPFLPLFFTALGVIFAVLLFFRVREYGAGEAVAADLPVTTSHAELRTPAYDDNPGTIVPIADGGAANDGSSTMTQSAREQRYRELLAAPPPPAPVIPAPVEKPSLFQRIVAPISNALGGGAPKPQVQQPPGTRQPQQQPPPPRRDPPQPGNGNNGEPGSGGNEQPEDDPTSDRTPPQIVTIEFQPPQVRDGEETVLIITARDDKSGIRSISGSIASPTNALQGFACQREPETERYLARISIPKDAAEGAWHINYLTLTDNASNSINLSWAQGMLPQTAAFKVVSSRPDSAGPTLKAVWLDRSAMRSGEKNTVFIQAEDDKAGVNLVSGVFQSPSKHARIGFGCRLGGTGAWECELSAPACLDCGVWQLEQIQLQDKANNMATVRMENPLVSQVKLDIAGGQCDALPPEMISVELDQTVVSNAEPTIINVLAQAEDNLCGVASLSGQALGPAGGGTQARIYFSFTNAGSPNSWVGRLQVPKLAAKGTWTISWIQVLDRGHNLKTYSSGDPALAGARFRVQ